MPDFPVTLSTGSQPIALRPVRDPAPPAIAQPEGVSSGRTSTDLQRQRPNQPPEQPATSDPPKQVDPKVLTGPPPAFSTSLLEVETNLKTAIERMAAAREKARNDMATAIDSDTVEQGPRHPNGLTDQG